MILIKAFLNYSLLEYNNVKSINYTNILATYVFKIHGAFSNKLLTIIALDSTSL